MKLTVLVDNNTYIDRYFFGEPGVSYFIEDGDKKILFDVGYSDVFIRNAQKMNLSLHNLDYVVISHGHFDHTWGLPFLIQYLTEAKIEAIDHTCPTLIAHPQVFQSKWCELNEIGSIISSEKLSRHFTMNLSNEPLWLTEKLVFLGEIERKNKYEAQKALGETLINNQQGLDYLMDDSALVYKADDGLVIITGCSHSGICNIIEHAKKVCNESRIIDIIGGFHLLNPDKEQLEFTVEYMRDLKPKELHACHCTDLNSKIALSKAANLKEVGVGLVLEY